MELEEDTYHNDAFQKKQKILRWKKVRLQPDEESYRQGSINRWSLVQILSPGKVVALFGAAIVLAELLLFRSNIWQGLSLHLLALVSMPFMMAVLRDRQAIYVLQALVLLPLIRLINVSMPISDAPLMLFIVVYIPLLVPVYLVIRHQGLTDVKLGIIYERLFVYIPLAVVIGVLLGAGEHLLIGSGYQIAGLSDPFIMVFASIVLFYVGLIEELIFRSLIQTRLEGLFGMTPGLLAASLLFGVMHSVYGEITEIIYIFAVGIVLGYMFQRTRSLPMVAAAHGVANIMLFVLLPLALQ
jgi:membrane protease YdiL (CAAX protease family)